MMKKWILSAGAALALVPATAQTVLTGGGELNPDLKTSVEALKNGKTCASGCACTGALRR